MIEVATRNSPERRVLPVVSSSGVRVGQRPKQKQKPKVPPKPKMSKTPGNANVMADAKEQVRVLYYRTLSQLSL